MYGYPQIRNFETDRLQKVSLKILKLADDYSFSE